MRKVRIYLGPSGIRVPNFTDATKAWFTAHSPVQTVFALALFIFLNERFQSVQPHTYYFVPINMFSQVRETYG